MVQIITWNKDDIEEVIPSKKLDEDGETVIDYDRDQLFPFRDVVVYSFSDDKQIDISETNTIISDSNGELLLKIDDINSVNSNFYQDVDDPPDTFYSYRWRYTTEDGWADELETFLDPSIFEINNDDDE